jgi:aminodeoxyfutalosine synthase
MVSGLHPDKPFSYYLGIVRALKQEFSEIHIKAFTPVEIQYFADISGLSVTAVLEQLINAGLGSLPGGGAEVLSPRVREALCPKKASAAQWLTVMGTAHSLGLKSNATLLWGHIETDEEIADHLLSLRDLQDETGGFQTFIPLPFHSANTELTGSCRPTAFEQLRLFAAARLLLDNFDHIKAYWIMTGLKIAQLALLFGADDVDGTVVEERITHAAGADTAQGLTKIELMDIIRQAGMRPVQRDTLYNEIETEEAAPS